MRTLIILSIVVLLKIEQQLARGLVRRVVPRRQNSRRNSPGPTSN
jgi:hypothetical protein